MKRKLISIGYDIPGFSEVCHDYLSDQSLLDADVIVFEPMTFDSGYGKPSYGEEGTFRITEATTHWSRELSTALEYGKTVFLIFRKYQVASVHTGRKEFKGSRTINYVRDYSNYEFLPTKLPSMTAKSGSGMAFPGDSVFTTFWKEFRDRLRYECYLNEKVKRAIFVTKIGEKAVGAVFKVGTGNLVVLPPIVYDEDEFVTKGKDGEPEWNPAAIAFGNRLVDALFDIDRALRFESAITPPPAWVKRPEFTSRRESSLLDEIDAIEENIQRLKDKELSLRAELKERELLKNLLFETGKTLEAAVAGALRMLGYSAENYDDGELELDHVIVSPEGDRFLGECEGKDNSAVNIDKFRQLSENIQADLQRQEVETQATGILFGNGFRLTEPKSREEQFTQKCLASARRGTILIRTADLYPIVRYLEEVNDESYKKDCRAAILAAIGRIVEFPAVPGTTSSAPAKEGT